MMLTDDIAVVMPEIILAVYAMIVLLVAVYTSKDKMAGLITNLTAVVMVGLAAMVMMGGAGAQSAFGGAFISDDFARFTKGFILLSAAGVLVMSNDFMKRHGMLKFEYPILVALSVVGMMIMVSAGDLMSLYMGLELQSLALYVVAAFNRDSVKSTEAGLKYFVLGALSSGILLYGASLIYGFAGSTVFSDIIAAADGQIPLGMLFGLTMVIIGLAFKVSAVPFHMWTPDVYEGSPTPVTALFATAPKMAAMGLFARVVYDAFGNAITDWSQIIALLSVLSMFLGAVAAIGQTSIKRMMAYSSISHMGFAMMGLAAGTVYGVEAMLIYMAIYVVTNLGTFAFILSMERDGRPVDDLSSLNQYSKQEPLKALALLVLLSSMIGLPIALGFFGKLAVLKAAVDADMTWLAIAAVIASVIGAFYYLRVIYYMYFGAENDTPLDHSTSLTQHLFLVGSAVIVVVGLFYQFGVEGFAAAAAQALVK